TPQVIRQHKSAGQRVLGWDGGVRGGPGLSTPAADQAPQALSSPHQLPAVTALRYRFRHESEHHKRRLPALGWAKSP
ncbi:hypothetical protein, partial [Mycobacteroides abscessus]|uniref:hypothetical protein n=1 Tax=Mycobacteroides abscessus TaxID=36809 RepID=UPI001A90E34B